MKKTIGLIGNIWCAGYGVYVYEKSEQEFELVEHDSKINKDSRTNRKTMTRKDFYKRFSVKQTSYDMALDALQYVTKIEEVKA